MLNNTEKNIIKDFVEGSDNAYSQLYKLYVKELFQYGKCFIKDDELLKDLIHDIYYKILVNRSLLNNVTNVKYFLFRALKNKIIDYSRSWNKNGMPLDNYFNAISVKLTAEENIIKKEEKVEIEERLKVLLNSLTVKQKEAVCLRFMHGMSYEEISQLLNMDNIKSARNLVSRAIVQIRKHNLMFLFL